MPDGTVSALGVGDRFFDRLPPHIHAGFTAEQRAAIGIALRADQGAPPPINIHLSLPVPPSRFYLSIRAGRDRRGRERRRDERRTNPLRTTRNLLFIGAAALVLYGTLAAVLLTSSIIPS